MKAARSIMATTTIAVALGMALVCGVGLSESMGWRMEPATNSQPAPQERSGLELALAAAANPRLKDYVGIQPLVGPVRSVKAPNLQKNLSTLNGQVKNLATGAYSAAKKAGPFVGSLATAAVHGVVAGAAFKFGGNLIGRFK